MDNFETINSDEEGLSTDPGEPELSHSDKIAGIFTEPSRTFESMSKFPVRTMDWLLPVFLLVIAIGLSSIITMRNPQLAYEAKTKQMEKMDKSFQDLVKEGKMTQEKADEQKAQWEERFDPKSPFFMIITFVSIAIFAFLFFFILAGIYFLFARFALGGVGTYTSSLAANGIVCYITIIQVLLTTILAFLFGRLISDVSVASLMNIDKHTFTGMLLSKIDVISIWVYIVLSIGLAKMFKASSAAKYYVMVFGLWIFWSLFIFFGSKSMPFLDNFIR